MSGLSTLTAREREIAALAVEGLTSAEIAEQVFLSPQTVKNHLSSVYYKLGISRRGRASAIELTRIMGAEVQQPEPEHEEEPMGFELFTYRHPPRGLERLDHAAASIASSTGRLTFNAGALSLAHAKPGGPLLLFFDRPTGRIGFRAPANAAEQAAAFTLRDVSKGHHTQYVLLTAFALHYGIDLTPAAGVHRVTGDTSGLAVVQLPDGSWQRPGLTAIEPLEHELLPKQHPWREQNRRGMAG